MGFNTPVFCRGQCPWFQHCFLLIMLPFPKCLSFLAEQLQFGLKAAGKTWIKRFQNLFGGVMDENYQYNLGNPTAGSHVKPVSVSCHENHNTLSHSGDMWHTLTTLRLE